MNFQQNTMEVKNLIIFSLIVISFNQSEAIDCKLEKPSSSAITRIFKEPQRDLGESYCTGFNVKQDDQETFDGCVTEIMQYLSEVKETADSVSNYVKYCKTSGVRLEFCTEMIVSLIKYCWKMADAIKLLHFDEKHLEITKLMYFTYKEVQLTPTDWEKLQVGNLSIESCLKDLASEGVGESGKNEKGVLEKYIQETKGKTQCNCIEVIGLEHIKTRLSFKENICDEICNKKEKDCVWSQKQLEAIAEVDLNSKEAKELGLDHEKIKKFLLSVGKPIREADWQSTMLDGTGWPFVYLMKQMLKDKQFNDEYIKLTVAALTAAMEVEAYEELISVLNKQGGTFQTPECRYQVIKKYLLSVSCTSKFNTANCNYAGYTKVTFVQNLKVLLEMKQSKTCDKFVTEFTDVFKQFYESESWDRYRFDEILGSCTKDGKTKFIKCVSGKK